MQVFYGADYVISMSIPFLTVKCIKELELKKEKKSRVNRHFQRVKLNTG